MDKDTELALGREKIKTNLFGLLDDLSFTAVQSNADLTACDKDKGNVDKKGKINIAAELFFENNKNVRKLFMLLCMYEVGT